jgi:ferredoxin-NADP reductase
MKRFIIKNMIRNSPDTLLLTLRPKHNEDQLYFTPGQYLALGFKKFGRPSPVRCFSIVSSPNHPGELQVGVRILGNFTRQLAKLKIGTGVFVYGPFGNFVMDPGYDTHTIFMAGGIGITPFMSMIRTSTENGSSGTITLLYSCRNQENIPFYQDLLQLERQNARLRVVFYITRGAVDKLREAHVVSGYINDTRLNELTSKQYNRFSYFMCGPKGFVENITGVLKSHNTDPDRIVTEEFTPTDNMGSGLVPGGKLSWWTYGLSGASLAMATAFFMVLDLSRAVPKLVSAQTSESSGQTTQAATPSASYSQPTTGSSNSTSSTSTAGTSIATQSQQSTYQAPVSSVS